MERIDDDHKLSSLRQYKTLNLSVAAIAALNCSTTIIVVVIMFVVKERSVERIFTGMMWRVLMSVSFWLSSPSLVTNL